jgi:hypothetical protein
MDPRVESEKPFCCEAFFPFWARKMLDRREQTELRYPQRENDVNQGRGSYEPEAFGYDVRVVASYT